MGEFFHNGYYLTEYFCKFCRTFIPVPGISVCNVLYVCGHTTPGTGTACFVTARSFCEYCTPVPHYPELLEILQDFRNRTRSFRKFYKIPIPSPATCMTSVRLWHNTWGTGMPCYNTWRALCSFRSNPKSVICIMKSYLVSHTNQTPNTSTYYTIMAPDVHISFLSLRAGTDEGLYT